MSGMVGRRFSEQGRAGIRAREQAKRDRLLAGGFIARVDKSGGPDACWPWTGAIQTGGGYGYFTVNNGRVVYVHRRVLELALGRTLGAREYACHRCDNPPCANPAHLFAGTQRENMRDASAKGRTRNGSTRLTADDVRAIRVRLAAGDSQRVVGQSFGVARSTIGSIAQGHRWGSVAA